MGTQSYALCVYCSDASVCVCATFCIFAGGGLSKKACRSRWLRVNRPSTQPLQVFILLHWYADMPQSMHTPSSTSCPCRVMYRIAAKAQQPLPICAFVNATCLIHIHSCAYLHASSHVFVSVCPVCSLMHPSCRPTMIECPAASNLRPCRR
jgi:hypothetical protein